MAVLARFHLSLLTVLVIALTARGEEVRGIIRKVDVEKKLLVIDVRVRGLRRTPMTFDLGRDVQIQVGKEPADLSYLQPGDRATVGYEDRDGRRLATSICTLGLRAAVAPERSRDEDVVAGTLARIVARDRELIVMSPDPDGGGASEVKLSVSQTAKILRDGKPIGLEELKEGERLSIRAEKRAEKLLAFEIQAGKVKAPVAPAADTRAERLRRLLQAADKALERMSNQSTPPPPSEPPPT